MSTAINILLLFTIAKVLPPPESHYIVDDFGNYITDDSGNRLITG